MSLKQKIAALVGLPVLTLLGIVIFGSMTINQVSGNLGNLVTVQLAALIDEKIIPLIKDDCLPMINEDFARIQQLQQSIQLMLEADRDVHQAVIAEKMALVASEESESRAADQANQENVDQARNRMNEASKSLFSADAKAKYADFATSFSSWTEATRKVITLSNTPGKLDFARKASDGGSAYKAFNDMRVRLDELQTLQGKDIEAQLATITARKARINQREAEVIENKTAALAAASGVRDAASTRVPIFLTLGLVMAAIVTVIGIFTARSISNPLSSLAHTAEQISKGDVGQSVTITSKDEIGRLANAFRDLIDYMKDMARVAENIAARNLTSHVEPRGEKDALGHSFNTMVVNLSSLIRQLTDNARDLVGAATEIAASAEQMSKGAKDQADQVVQVSASVDEMNATILQSSHNAAQATTAAQSAADTATSGGQIVNDTITGMVRIASVVRESSDSIGKLANSADRIGEIIDVIDDIADQTNLLALNAAIEAARAGEQGRGFAVVADEVRKLAERTGKATNEITAMIKGIQRETQDAVHSMQAGISEVEKGRELTDRAGTSLNEIVTMAQQVTDMITEMAKAAEEQSTTAEQIGRNIEHISTVTKETADGAAQSATAAEELNRRAEELKEMVSQFKV